MSRRFCIWVVWSKLVLAAHNNHRKNTSSYRQKETAKEIKSSCCDWLLCYIKISFSLLHIYALQLRYTVHWQNRCTRCNKQQWLWNMQQTAKLCPKWLCGLANESVTSKSCSKSFASPIALWRRLICQPDLSKRPLEKTATNIPPGNKHLPRLDNLELIVFEHNMHLVHLQAYMCYSKWNKLTCLSNI